MQRTDFFELSIEDITADRALFERFKNIIPVLAIDGEVRLAGSALSNRSGLLRLLRKTVLSD